MTRKLNKKIKKRPFLLLELLIALSLVTLCLIPLLSPQIKMTMETIQWIEEKQLARHADNAFALVLQKLYENGDEKNPERIQWEQFGKNRKYHNNLENHFFIFYPKGKSKLIHASFTIETTNEKEKANDEGFRRILVTINFDEFHNKKTFEYPLIVIKGDVKR